MQARNSMGFFEEPNRQPHPTQIPQRHRGDQQYPANEYYDHPNQNTQTTVNRVSFKAHTFPVILKTFLLTVVIIGGGGLTYALTTYPQLNPLNPKPAPVPKSEEYIKHEEHANDCFAFYQKNYEDIKSGDNVAVNAGVSSCSDIFTVTRSGGDSKSVGKSSGEVAKDELSGVSLPQPPNNLQKSSESVTGQVVDPLPHE